MPNGAIEFAVDAHHTESRRTPAPAAQLLASGNNPLIRVNHQIPLGICKVKGVVASCREVVGPFNVVDFGAARRRKLRSAVH